MDELICKLVAYNGSLQLAHWTADTVTNEHKALGDLYETMSELTDEFAQTYMGKNGVIEICDAEVCKMENPVQDGLELTKELTTNLTEGDDDDLLNIVADMNIALNTARYLLKSKQTKISGVFSKADMPKE